MTIFQWLLNIILSIVMIVANAILIPIDYLINLFLPSLSSALDTTANFINTLAQYIGWAISLSGLPAGTISLIALFTVFKLTTPINVWFIKLAISWYRALKP